LQPILVRAACQDLICETGFALGSRVTSGELKSQGDVIDRLENTPARASLGPDDGQIVA